MIRIAAIWAAATLGAFSVFAGTAGRARIWNHYLELPLRFEARRGPGDARVEYLSRGSGYTLVVAADEAVLVLRKAAVRMKLVGADPASPAQGLNRLPGVGNYLVGNDPSRWRRDVPGFARVRYRSVYPGVDLVYYGNQRQLEYDFVVGPGADPNAIRLEFEGAGNLRVDRNGDLVLRTRAGEIRQHRPIVYQGEGAARRLLDGRYTIEGGRRVAFRVGRYDARQPLVIDPKISYSTYIGGSADESAFDIAVDDTGCAYITGVTGSVDFPTTGGAWDRSLGPNWLPMAQAFGDAFVTKIAPDGKSLVWSTFLGGNGADGGNAIALDKDGNVAIIGATLSTDFPLTRNAYQTQLKGDIPEVRNAFFVAKLNAQGNALVYSTLISGGSGLVDFTFEGMALALDAAGNIYIAGQTTSDKWPTTPGAAQRDFGGGQFDAFAAKLNPNAATGAASLVYSTYLGGNENESALAIVTDKAGNAYLRGGTCSPNFPVTKDAFQVTKKGRCDAFLTKVSPDGKQLLYSTFLGGGGNEYYELEGSSRGPLGGLSEELPPIFASEFGGSAFGAGLAMDSAGRLYVTGATNSTDFPTTPGAYQKTLKGGLDAFLVKLDITRQGSAALLYGTYLGGSQWDRAQAVVVDTRGRIVVRGETNSADFPVTSDAVQKQNGGGYDSFLAVFDPAGKVPFSTYLGGSHDERGFFGLAVDAFGSAYVAGASQTATRNGWDAVVTKIEFEGLGPQITLAGIGHAASYATGKVSPGEIIVIYGKDFGPPSLAGLQLVGGMVGAEIGETKVYFDGVAAPMIYALSGVLSCVTPYGVAGQASTEVQIEFKKQKGNVVTVPVVPAVPGIFSLDQSGTGQGAILNQDYSLNGSRNPIQPGQVAMIYATGEGQTDPPGVDGRPAMDVFPKPVLRVTVTIGGLDAEVLYAGAAPNFVAGVMQINVRIPTGVPAGAAELIVQAGDYKSQTGLTLAVK